MATCFLNNVYCCYLPAHCSHGLQPLDNGVFNASKAAYRRELERFALLTDSTPMDKVNQEVVNQVDVNQLNPTQRSLFLLINQLNIITILSWLRWQG